MQFSKTTEYAVRAIIYLSIHPGVQKMEDIALEMDIPKGYLVKVLRKLKIHKIIQTYQGVNGGFQLNVYKDKIRLYDIMCITEKTMKLNSCMESGKCALDGGKEHCRAGAYGFYCQLQCLFEEKIKGVTIADLVKNLGVEQEG